MEGSKWPWPRGHEDSLIFWYPGIDVYLSSTARLLMELRAPLCVVLAAVIGIAFNSAREPHEQQGQGLSSVVALAPQAVTTIKANWGEQRAENARQRTPATFPVMPSDDRPIPERRLLAALVRHSRPESLYTEYAQRAISFFVNNQPTLGLSTTRSVRLG
jgi:hypothetical protein